MRLLMKRCPRCKTEKARGEFYKSKTLKDELASWCKACDNEKGKTYYRANRDKVRERHKKEYERNKTQIFKRKKAT